MATNASAVALSLTAYLRQVVSSRRRSDDGASLVEYGLLVALIALVCFAAVAFFGGETGESFSRVGDSVQNS